MTVAAVLLMGLAATAHAQLPGDLVLGFSETSIGTNVEVDLGAASNYASSGDTPGTYNIANLSSDLTAAYGSGWTTDQNLSFAIIGSNSFGSSSGSGPKRSIWADAYTYPATPYVTGSSSTGNSSANGAITGMYTGSAGSFGGSSTTTLTDINGSMVSIGSNTVTLHAMSTATSTSGSLAASWGASGNFNIPNTTASSLFQSAAVGTNGAATEEVFYFAGTATGQNAVDIQAVNGQTSYFTLGTNGELSFTVVPEPSTYAAIIGVAVLGYSLLRRRKVIA